MMGTAPIRHEWSDRPLERATSPGRGADVERGTWCFLGFSMSAAPDNEATGERTAHSAPQSRAFEGRSRRESHGHDCPMEKNVKRCTNSIVHVMTIRLDVNRAALNLRQGRIPEVFSKEFPRGFVQYDGA